MFEPKATAPHLDSTRPEAAAGDADDANSPERTWPILVIHGILAT